MPAHYKYFTWLPNHINRGIDPTTKDKFKQYFKKYLSQLLDLATVRYKEPPFGYNENTFTGFLAQAAYKQDWYALIDYVEHSDNERKVYRPDMYISWAQGQDKSVVFEIKKDNGITLGSKANTVSNRLKYLLKESYNQIYRHEKKDEALFWL